MKFVYLFTFFDELILAYNHSVESTLTQPSDVMSSSNHNTLIKCCDSCTLLSHHLYQSVTSLCMALFDRLCGLVVRVLDYRSGGLGSIPGTTRKQSSGSGTGSTQPREYN
jgi:hypothetical protein